MTSKTFWTRAGSLADDLGTETFQDFVPQASRRAASCAPSPGLGWGTETSSAEFLGSCSEQAEIKGDNAVETFCQAHTA